MRFLAPEDYAKACDQSLDDIERTLAKKRPANPHPLRSALACMIEGAQLIALADGSDQWKARADRARAAYAKVSN